MQEREEAIILVYDDAITTMQKLASDTTEDTFLKLMANVGYKYILAELGRSVLEKTRTATAVADQQYYQMAPDFLWAKSVTVTVGSTVYTLDEIESQEEWNYLNTTSQSGTPDRFFVRPYWGVGGVEIGLFPKPASTYTITTVYEAGDKDLSVDAYATGTVTMVNGDEDVTGDSTVWTAAMVGRYFTVTTAGSDGMWYKVASRSSNTAIKLENYYDGVAGSSLAYKIAEAFALPEEMQILPVYYALSHYFAMKQNEKKQADYYSLFNSGLQLGKRRYATKARGNTIRKNPWRMWGGKVYPNFFPESISS